MYRFRLTNLTESLSQHRTGVDALHDHSLLQDAAKRSERRLDAALKAFKSTVLPVLIHALSELVEVEDGLRFHPKRCSGKLLTDTADLQARTDTSFTVRLPCAG